LIYYANMQIQKRYLINILLVTLIALGACAKKRALIHLPGVPAANNDPFAAILVQKVGPGTLYPNPSRTPGALNPAVNDNNVNSTICVSGYTATIRPPVSYTNGLKQQQMRDWNLPGTAAD